MTRVLLILLLSVAFGSCKKKNLLEQSITGTVTNFNSGQGVASAKVTIKARVIEGGIIHSNFSDLVTGYTSADGTFDLNFDKINAAEYRVEVSHASYFTTIASVSTDAVNGANPYNINIGVGSQSAVSVHFFNEEPVDSSEKFSYGYKGAELPCNCCTKEVITFIGPADSSISCNVYGEKYFTYSYTIVAAGKPITQVIDSAYCTAGQTTQININY